MNKKEFSELLNILNACSPAKGWANGKNLKTVWQTCERGDWMLWLAKRMQDKPGWPDLRALTLAKARCAKLVLHLMKDDRSKKAVEVAEQFGLGNVIREELNAYAAYAAAAYAAAAYARNKKQMEVLKQCAEICREILTVPNQ